MGIAVTEKSGGERMTAAMFIILFVYTSVIGVVIAKAVKDSFKEIAQTMWVESKEVWDAVQSLKGRVRKLEDEKNDCKVD